MANAQLACALLEKKISAKDEELNVTHSRLVKAHGLWQKSSSELTELEGKSSDLKATLDRKELELKQACDQLVVEKKKGFWQWVKGRFSRE